MTRDLKLDFAPHSGDDFGIATAIRLGRPLLIGAANSAAPLICAAKYMWLHDDTPAKRFRTGTGRFDTRVYKLFEALQSLEDQVFRLDAKGSAAAYKHSTAHLLHQLGVIAAPEHMHGTPFLGKDLPSTPEFVHGTRDRMYETLETTRWISDGRYLFVRSYRRDGPVDQQSLTSFYNSSGELCAEIREMAAQGSLDPVQKTFWETPRPAVRLFDCAEDPWNLRDLTADSSQGGRIARMEGALETWMLSERDLGFWPEPELTEAERKAAAYHLARRDPDSYPLERILETAKLIDLDALRVHLSDEQSLVREWSVSGLAALGEEAAPVLPALVPLLDDSSVSVRIEAAHLIARLDTGAARAKALRLLAAHLDSDAPWVAPRAARALELLGEISRPTITAMQSALRERGAGFQGTPKGPRPVHLSLEFSLRSALKALEKPTQTE